MNDRELSRPRPHAPRPHAPGQHTAGPHAPAPRSEARQDSAGTASDPVARFRYDALTATWWWSDQLLAVFGHEPGTSDPSFEALMEQVHPEDRPRLHATIAGALADGAAFSSRHRILTLAREQRHVVVIGEGVRANGSVIAVRGYLLDQTAPLRRDVEQETAEGIARSVATRAVIEQAKGALMATYGVSADEAFQALRAYSNHTNVKLNALAAYLVAELANPVHARLRPQEKVGEILAAVTDQPGLLHHTRGGAPA